MEISSLLEKYTNKVLKCPEKNKFCPEVFSAAINFVLEILEDLEESNYDSEIKLSSIFEHFFSKSDLLSLYNRVQPEDFETFSYKDIDYTFKRFACKRFLNTLYVVFGKARISLDYKEFLSPIEEVYLFKGMVKHNYFGFGFLSGEYPCKEKSNRICRTACKLPSYEYEDICEVLVDGGLLLNNSTFDINTKKDKAFKTFISSGKLPLSYITAHKEEYSPYPLVPEVLTEQEPKPVVVNPNRDGGFSLEGLNTSEDLKMIVNAVKKFKEAKEKDPDAPRMNILLTGNPGTGKTEFVKYVGRETGKEVDIIMGSDVLCKYVGETEAAIKTSFESAKKNDHIIFLDELDGLLATREDASRGFEVTQVNEILRCMENFEGVMFAATNCKDRVDKAAIRRFTFKVEFYDLTDDGKQKLWERLFKNFNAEFTKETRLALDKINPLTPGDFRTVRQRLYYLDTAVTSETLLSGLQKEADAKQTSEKLVKVGFGR